MASKAVVPEDSNPSESQSEVTTIACLSVRPIDSSLLSMLVCGCAGLYSRGGMEWQVHTWAATTAKWLNHTSTGMVAISCSLQVVCGQW